MGFMDKAKQLAEQAQQKLDEAQESFNQQRSQSDAPEGQTVQYDQHGRPVEPAPPAAEAPPPSAEPPTSRWARRPRTLRPEPPADDANATPDPFKPLQ